MLCHSAVGRKCVPCFGRGGRCALKDASPTECSSSFPSKTGVITMIYCCKLIIGCDGKLRPDVEGMKNVTAPGKSRTTRGEDSKESCRFLGGYLTTDERYRWFGRTRPASPRFDLAEEMRSKSSLSCAYGQKLVRKQKCVGLNLTRISGRNSTKKKKGYRCTNLKLLLWRKHRCRLQVMSVNTGATLP